MPVVMAPRMPKERAAPVPAADEARSRVPPVGERGCREARGWMGHEAHEALAGQRAPEEHGAEAGRGDDVEQRRDLLAAPCHGTGGRAHEHEVYPGANKGKAEHAIEGHRMAAGFFAVGVQVL